LNYVVIKLIRFSAATVFGEAALGGKRFTTGLKVHCHLYYISIFRTGTRPLCAQSSPTEGRGSPFASLHLR